MEIGHNYPIIKEYVLNARTGLRVESKPVSTYEQT